MRIDRDRIENIGATIDLCLSDRTRHIRRLRPGRTRHVRSDARRIQRQQIAVDRAPSPLAGMREGDLLDGRRRDGVDLGQFRSTGGDMMKLAAREGIARATAARHVDVGDVRRMPDQMPVIVPVTVIPVIVVVAEKVDRKENVQARADPVKIVAIAANVVAEVVRVIAVVLIVDSGKAVRWKRRPPDIAIAIAPAYPRRSPRVARHPDPTVIVEVDPAAIVVRGPAELLVGNPGPAIVGIGPIAVGIGRPVGVIDLRLPDISVVAALDPASLTGESVVKSLKRGVPLRHTGRIVRRKALALVGRGRVLIGSRCALGLRRRTCIGRGRWGRSTGIILSSQEPKRRNG